MTIYTTKRVSQYFRNTPQIIPLLGKVISKESLANKRSDIFFSQREEVGTKKDM